jgi:CPA2 family monovalent cation:H+ antiporter-2
MHTQGIDQGLLRDLLVVLSASILVVVALHRLRLPTIAGLLVAGAAIGPTGLALVGDTDAVGRLAEIGVVMLLFSIGLEFSLASLRRIARMLCVGGALQVGLTLGATFATATLLGHTGSRALFFGFLVALSSTAIVLRGLSERGEVEAPHGRLIVGVLLFQDLCVVPMMLVTPMLASEATDFVSIALALAKAAVVMVLTVVLARFIVPRIFQRVAQTQRRDVFLLAVVLVCAGIAWATSLVGLSLALGAFLAGIVLADGEYGHQALADVLPLRDLFTSLFFVSVGMLLDLDLLAHAPQHVLSLAVFLLALKFVVAVLAALFMRLPARVALLAGAGLAQVGEFSFVLADLGADVGLMSGEERATFLAASVLTMLITPLLLRLGPHLAAGARRLERVDRLFGVRDEDVVLLERQREGHVVILGYGVGGALLARALKRMSVEYVIVDLDLDRVRAGRASGEPIGYGDVTSPEILEHLGIARASYVAVMLNDPDATRRVVLTVRQLAPRTSIHARARDQIERSRLISAGATDVSAQEVEASLQLMENLLIELGRPRDQVVEVVRDSRASLDGA